MNLAVTFRFGGSSPWWVSFWAKKKKVYFYTSKLQCWGSGMAGFGLITGSVITPLPAHRAAPKQPAASVLCNRMHSSVTTRQGNCHLTPTTWQGEQAEERTQTHTRMTQIKANRHNVQTKGAFEQVCTHRFTAYKMSVDGTNPVIIGYSENHSEHPCELWGLCHPLFSLV